MRCQGLADARRLASVFFGVLGKSSDVVILPLPQFESLHIGGKDVP